MIWYRQAPSIEAYDAVSLERSFTLDRDLALNYGAGLGSGRSASRQTGSC